MNFVEELNKINIEPTEVMLNQFEIYYNKLVEVNQYMNLTAITEREEVYKKHFLDSLFLMQAIDHNKEYSLCDVGSGAGFPSIPLAITNKNLNVVIIDALNKRIKFLNDLISDLKLENAVAYHERAEDYVKKERASFDIVTARAVAKLNILAELCLPLVKMNGLFIAMKGQDGLQELDEAAKAISILGGKVEKTIELELPEDAGKREIIVIRKVKETPTKYPRIFAKIKEKPL